MSLVYVGGTFDLFHMGHVELLREAQTLAYIHEAAPFSGKVIVALNSDEFVEQYKGKRPVCSYEERRAVLESVRYVDRVIPNAGGSDSRPAILSVRPDYLCVGSDWTRDAYLTQMGITDEWLVEQQIRVHIIPRTTGCSSSNLRARLQ
jgi:glycerol-3-phosphate cytidylyltransferase